MGEWKGREGEKETRRRKGRGEMRGRGTERSKGGG